LYADFVSNAIYAFSPLKRKEGVKYQDYEIAEPLHYSVVPEPPPLTREFLYRAVFNEVDTSSGTKEGYITLNKLVKTMHKVLGRVYCTSLPVKGRKETGD
jgi:hypothetical protein